MHDRFDLWRKRYLPTTFEGKNTVAKNSALACIWFAVEHQAPPNLDQLISEGTKAAWDFHDETPSSLNSGSKGATYIRRTALIHDHVNGGTRAADVETFARSLYARQAIFLSTPSFADYQRFAFSWLNDQYGHLRQGHRILTSTCDFLQMKACPSRFWRIAFQCLGMIRGISPNTTQSITTEHLRSYRDTPIASSTLRPVNIRPHWSLLEVLMEPFFYNPNIPGRWGARHDDPPFFISSTRQNRGIVNAAIIRISKELKDDSNHIFGLTKKMAKMRCTHITNLLTGVNPSGRMRLMSYTQYQNRAQQNSIAPPLLEESYNALIQAILSLTQWKEALQMGRDTQIKYPNASLRDIIQLSPKPPGTWFLFTNNQSIGMISPSSSHIISTLYNIDSCGVLHADPSILPRSSEENQCEQAHVWLAAPIPHTNARTREPDSRPSTPGDTPKSHKPPPLRHSGIIADWDVVLRRRQSPSGSLHQKAPVSTNPANFAYTFGAVDSSPEPVPCSGMDIFHFHWSQLSHQWTPQRTLDPSTQATFLQHQPAHPGPLSSNNRSQPYLRQKRP